MKNPFFERRCRYSIRKLSVGACSLMIGAVLFAGPALAEETAVPENSGANTELVSGESEHPTNEADKQHEGEHARENKPEKAEGVATASETASPASNQTVTTEAAEAVSAAKPEEKASEVAAETPSAEAKPKSDKEIEAKPEATSQGDESKLAEEANKVEKEVQPDVPKKKEENKTAQVDTSKDTKEQLKQATDLYKKFVENQVDTLLKDTEKFAETIKAGNLEEAKKQYPVIRMAYERSEPIAESFGELDVNIDFRLADYLEENKTEEGWRGFHRIEKIMWEQNTTKGTEEYADQLVKDIKELKAKVATVEVTPDLMVTGAVDLLNEVATQKITGEEEIYSHTDLYDFKANIEGAEEIFKIFKPLIEKKDSKLAKDLTEKFATINGLLDKYKTDDKHYKLYTDLTKENTKELSEAVTKLGEPLSQMGVILDEEAK